MPNPPSRQKVRDHRFSMPTTGIETKRKAVPIMLDPESGVFCIELPTGVASVIGRSGRSEISGRSLDEVCREFDRQIERYQHFVRAEGRTKVIVIHFAYNRPYEQGFGVHYGLGRSHIVDGQPQHALGLEYEVLWRVDDYVFDIPLDENDEPYGPPNCKYHIASKDRKFLEWTAEREAFFANMIEGLNRLIDQVREFIGGDLEGYVNNAIASGMGGLALPAPKGDA